MNNRPLIKKYLSNIKKELHTNSLLRHNMLSDLKHSIKLYLIENPDTTITDLESHFGTPKDIAESYYATLNPITQRKKIILLISIIICVVILIIGLFIYLNPKIKENNAVSEEWDNMIIIEKIEEHEVVTNSAITSE